MNRNIIREKLIEIIVYKTSIDIGENGLKTLIMDAGFDSIEILEIIIEIENVFDFEFDICDDINALMNNFEMLIDYIYMKVGLN